MAPDKSVYFAKYYKDNRPAILAKRRLRYKNDPEYRAKMQEKARDRARRKAEERRKSKIAAIQQKGEDLKAHTVDLDAFGSQMVKHWPVGDFVTATVVAEALGVSLATLGNWIRNKLLPQPTIMSTAGKYLFSVEYMHLVRDCRIESLSQGLVNGDFGKLVHKKYESIRDKEDLLRRGGLDE